MALASAHDRTDSRTNPASDLWGKSGEATFITTGKPMAAATRAASAADRARPSPARGMPKDSSRRRDASAPKGVAPGPPASVRAVAAPFGRRRDSGARDRNVVDATWYRSKARSAAKQLRNDRNSGTPASTSVVKPCSSVLNEFHVTTMGFSTSSMKATMSSAKRSVSRPNAPVSPITITSTFRSAAMRSKTRLRCSTGACTRNWAPLSTGLATVR